MTSICQDPELSISPILSLWWTEDKIPQCEIGIRELIWRQGFIQLHFEISMNWFCKLNKRQTSSRKHIWLCDSYCVIFTVFFQAVSQILKCQSMLFFEKRHQVLHDFQKNWFLFFQNVKPGILIELQSFNKTSILNGSHPIISLDFKGSCNPPSHCFFLDMINNHVFKDSSSCSSFPEFNI